MHTVVDHNELSAKRHIARASREQYVVLRDQTIFDFEHDLLPFDDAQQAMHAQLTPGERIQAGMNLSECVLAGLRGAFRAKNPGWSQRRVNLAALAWATPISGRSIENFIRDEPADVLS